ncbi:IclR family transcriptional regulator [Bartonella sp. LJL80]
MIKLLDHIAATEDGATVSQLSRDLGMAKSSVHALCHTLLQENLLTSSDTGRYIMGPHAIRWSNAYLKNNRLADGFRQIIRNMPELDNYTLTLSLREGADVVYIDTRNSLSPLGVTFRIGMRIAAVFSATGKAILSRLPEETLKQITSEPLPEPMTQYSIQTVAALKRELDKVRTQGYSLDNGQIHPEMICVGAPILNRDGYASAGIALSMPRSLATDMLIAELGPKVAHIADQLTERFSRILD